MSEVPQLEYMLSLILSLGDKNSTNRKRNHLGCCLVLLPQVMIKIVEAVVDWQRRDRL